MFNKVADPLDQELLQGIYRADARQVERLYTEFFPGIMQFILDNSGTEADARDVFQETIMVIYKKIRDQTLELDVPLQAYLYAVSRNIWFSHLRYKKSKPTINPQECLPDADADTAGRIEKVQMEQLFHKHFSSLEKKCRDILRSFFSKVPMKTIAAKYNTSEAYIKKRKHYCKNHLVKAIQNDPLYNELLQ